MKQLFKNDWFNLAVPVLVFFATVANSAIGAALILIYFVAWGLNKAKQ